MYVHTASNWCLRVCVCVRNYACVMSDCAYDSMLMRDLVDVLWLIKSAVCESYIREAELYEFPSLGGDSSQQSSNQNQTLQSTRK